MKCLTLFVAARWIYYLRASLKKSTNCCCHYLLCFGLYTGPAKNLSHTRCPLRCFTPAIPVLILLHQVILLYMWELRTALDQLILCCAASSAKKAAEIFHLILHFLPQNHEIEGLDAGLFFSKCTQHHHQGTENVDRFLAHGMIVAEILWPGRSKGLGGRSWLDPRSMFFVDIGKPMATLMIFSW